MSASRVYSAKRHFDLSIALKMARAAELAYNSPDVVERALLADRAYSKLRFFDVESTQCFVAADRDSIVVCFRGTEGRKVEDWIVDLNFELVKGPWGGKVHEGFYDALSCVWTMLDGEVRRLQEERPRRLWVTGHSLGAALATLAVARWLDAGLPIAGMYTFGQPRTGDRPFARRFDFEIRAHAFRIVNNLDIVTRTPPRSLGYRHLGTFVYFNDSGELHHDVGWWQQFLTGWHGTVETILKWGGEGVKDHSMTGYRRCLEQAQGTHVAKPQAAGPPSPATPDQRPGLRLVMPRRRVA